jgi:hypothetical protein
LTIQWQSYYNEALLTWVVNLANIDRCSFGGDEENSSSMNNIALPKA